MRIALVTIALTLTAFAAHAQNGDRGAGVPSSIASAGITQTEWSAIREEVSRQARRVRVSQAALLAAAEAAGAELARSGRFEAGQLQHIIVERIAGQADQIVQLQARLDALRGDPDPSIALVYANARTALEGGRLSEADRLLAEAAERDLATLRQADAEVERRRLRAGETVAARGQVAYLQADYLAASDFMARAGVIVPQSAVEARWAYHGLQADALRQRGEVFGESDRLREAVRLFRDVVLPLAPRTERPDDWAKTQLGLGIALDVLGAQGDMRATHEAVAAHRAALTIWTQSNSPVNWAGAQTNLGAALNTLGERGDEGALRQAIDAFRAALNVSTRNADPQAWAALQNNLSVAYRVLGLGGDVQSFRNAATAARAALEVDTRARDPNAWAKDTVSLANALSGLGERGDERALDESIEAYRAALEVQTRARDPSGWAATQINLASALYTRGRLFDRHAFEQSRTALVGALEIFTRESAPAYWASAQINLGRTLLALGEQGDGPNGGLDLLRAAVAAYRAALTVNTQEAAPALWARDQANLGDALNTLGRRTNNVADLELAVAAYTAALSVQTRDRVPEAWAMTNINLGVAYLRLDHRGVRGALDDAVTAFRAALEVLTFERNREQWGEAQANLAVALTRQAERNDRGRYRDAATAYRAALRAFTPQTHPQQWGEAQAGLSGVLEAQGQLDAAAEAFSAFVQTRSLEDDPEAWALAQRHLGDLELGVGAQGDERALARAIVAYRAALRVWTRERDAIQWGAAQGNLGTALTEFYNAGGDEAALQEAVLAFRRALSVVTRARDPDTWATRQHNLATTLHIMVRRGDRRRLPEALAAAQAGLEGFREVGDLQWARRAEQLVADLNALQ